MNRSFAALGAIAVVVGIAVSANAQGLTVLPVTLQLVPGQTTATLTVINQSDNETSFQVRGFAWTQPNGIDTLVASNELLTSPPLGTIAPNASQVVRMVLRHPPQAQEASYRILLDQIPPPAVPGTVRIALRLSIPVFAEPAARVAPHVTWHIETASGQSFLVGTNDGNQHELVRDIALVTTGGSTLRVEANVSPYILPGATRRWRIEDGVRAASGTQLRLKALAIAGTIDQPIAVTGTQ